MATHIVAIIGTVRPGNMTSKALAVVVDELRSRDDVEVSVVDPVDYELGMPGQESPGAKALGELVASARGVILATPEYHGSFAACMKLVIENMGFPSALKGKPVALMGVASGAIGAVKSLEQLRGVCAHVGAIVLPGPVSVAGVNKVFDSDDRIVDDRTAKRLRGLADSLLNYLGTHQCHESLERFVR